MISLKNVSQQSLPVGVAVEDGTGRLMRGCGCVVVLPDDGDDAAVAAAAEDSVKVVGMDFSTLDDIPD